ncbi:DUF945 family protein [Spiribacter sp. 2438]|uniref:DUF945 family protein n=1 Tax=Spiribacter sp. 2438 TaxID=2666185 RepID=UPI0012B058D2|nr:DUF945 family protein [Spiribacter sp. 2438]QGM21267.1 DUF945 family protein [Spiribacter sp. 2438]
MHRGIRAGALAFLGVLAVGLAALPVINGIHAERIYRTQVDAAEAQLLASGPNAPTLALMEYQRGLYRSEAITRVTWPEAAADPVWRHALELPEGPLELVLETTVRHGIDGVRYQGGLTGDGPVVRWLEALGGGPESLQLAGRIGYRAQTMTLEVAELDGRLPPAEQLHLNSGALSLELRYHPRREALDGQLEWPGLTLTDPRGGDTITLREVSGGWQLAWLAVDDQGLWVGENHLDTGLVVLTSLDQPPVRVDGLRLATRSRLADSGHMTVGASLDWDRLSVAPNPTLDGGLALKAEGLPLEPFLALSAGDALDADLLARLAEGGPRLSLERLRLAAGPGRGVAADGSLQVSPAMAGPLRQGVGSWTLLAFVDAGVSLTMDPALADQMAPVQRDWLRQLEAFGVLRRSDDQWHTELTFQDGALRVNDVPWWRMP